MIKEVTLDSSVLVSVFVKGDEFRLEARRIMEKVFSGKYHAVTSVIVPIEVCGSISRRVGGDKALSVKSQLSKWESMNFVIWLELTRRRMEEAAVLAVKLKLRGMDAIVVQTAEEKRGALITFDDEIADKAKADVEVLTYKDFRT